jgi:hypothetical protein
MLSHPENQFHRGLGRENDQETVSIMAAVKTIVQFLGREEPRHDKTDNQRPEQGHKSGPLRIKNH